MNGQERSYIIYDKTTCLTKLTGKRATAMTSESVKVIVRCRPLNDREEKLDCQVCACNVCLFVVFSYVRSGLNCPGLLKSHNYSKKPTTTTSCKCNTY